MDRNNKMKIHELTSEITALQSRLNEQTASYENHMVEAKRHFHDEEVKTYLVNTW